MPTELKIEFKSVRKEWIDRENHKSEANKAKIECETVRLITIISY